MRIFLLFALITFSACKSVDTVDPIIQALSSKNQKIENVVSNLNKHEVQIMFTEISRDNSKNVHFTDYKFQVNDSVYFYPASSVKFPIAVLALEKLNEQNLFDINTIYNVEGDSVKSSFAKDIMKIFVVSDNDAYNRLFEYLGKDEINSRLNNKGIKARISHRLSINNSDELSNKSLVFNLEDDTLKTKSIKNKPISSLNLKQILKGKGYIEHDSLIKKPKDFSKKNYLPLSSLHEMMKRLMFPEKFPKEQQFHLSAANREFLLNAMKTLPKNAGYSNEYYDGYVKFFLFGDTKDPIPSHIEIYNKVGYAYGYLTDCAYIINKKLNKEYIISATIHVNENRIFNDDIYEYDSIGIPFLAELGRELVLN